MICCLPPPASSIQTGRPPHARITVSFALHAACPRMCAAGRPCVFCVRTVRVYIRTRVLVYVRTSVPLYAQSSTAWLTVQLLLFYSYRLGDRKLSLES
jgi:hypothetical protein